MHTIWDNFWKHTVEKSQTNATSVTLHALIQVLWGHIWKRTVEKSHTNATNVTTHLLLHTIWGHIWRHTARKGETNAANVTSHLLLHSIWGCIWKHTVTETPSPRSKLLPKFWSLPSAKQIQIVIILNADTWRHFNSAWLHFKATMWFLLKSMSLVGWDLGTRAWLLTSLFWSNCKCIFFF